jgi:hypothetical protein
MGFASAMFITQRLLGMGGKKKRNPVWSRGYAFRATKRSYAIPVTHVRMGLDEVRSALLSGGYQLLDNYNDLSTAIRSAQIQEAQGYEAKVVTTQLPLARRPERAHPHWVLVRRKRARRNPRRVSLASRRTLGASYRSRKKRR